MKNWRSGIRKWLQVQFISFLVVGTWLISGTHKMKTDGTVYVLLDIFPDFCTFAGEIALRAKRKGTQLLAFFRVKCCPASSVNLQFSTGIHGWDKRKCQSCFCCHHLQMILLCASLPWISFVNGRWVHVALFLFADSNNPWVEVLSTLLHFRR